MFAVDRLAGDGRGLLRTRKESLWEIRNEPAAPSFDSSHCRNDCRGAALIGTQPAAADQSGVPAGPAGCQEERNREVVLGALQNVFAEHRTDMVDQYFADNFVQHSPCVPPGGREELKNWWTGMVYAIPDIIITTDQTVTKCAEVVTFRTITGTVVHDLPALGITGNGQQLQFRAADIFRVQNGKITEHWETVDTGPLVTLALGR
ncbi:ester cyclase [Nocardia xishanensis]|uniref:Ester cyclase n=1 Tax=Nocardia xishanensis TaxID=238964 RepID=A0ABW7WWW0_9NOCA